MKVSILIPSNHLWMNLLQEWHQRNSATQETGKYKTLLSHRSNSLSQTKHTNENSTQMIWKNVSQCYIQPVFSKKTFPIKRKIFLIIHIRKISWFWKNFPINYKATTSFTIFLSIVLSLREFSICLIHNMLILIIRIEHHLLYLRKL